MIPSSANSLKEFLKAKSTFFMTVGVVWLSSLSSGFANAGLPMLIIIWPLLWLAFIPIVLIEYSVLKKIFIKEAPNRILFITAGANLFSTAIGIPLIYLVLLLLEMLIPGGAGTFPDLPEFWRRILSVTLQAPWLLPHESEFYWMIPVACGVLFIPFYYMSYWVEGIIISRYMKNSCAPNEVKEAVKKANRASYAFLYMILLAWLIYGIYIKAMA